MQNCPDSLYFACKNAQNKCNKCAAGTNPKSNKLLFEPIAGREHLLPHPYELTLKGKIVEAKNKKTSEAKAKRQQPNYKAKSKLVKKSLDMEKKVVQRFNRSVKNADVELLKQTIASGSVFGDGDIKSIDGFLQIDHKYRTTTNSFTVSRKEYLKGTNQGTNCWIITAGKSPAEEETMVVLTEKTFTQLLALAKEQSA